MEVNWWKSVSAFLRSRIFRTLTVIVVVACSYTVLVNKIEHLLFEIELNFATTITAFFGLTMSLLMVYRTNSAYDRWWEGRKVWGQLVNECRNLVVKACSLSRADVARKKELQKLVAAFPPALRDHLRRARASDSMVPEGVVHGPNYVTEKVYAHLQSWRDEGTLDDFAFLTLNEHARAFLDVCGKCERIQNTPLPLSHRALIPQVLFLYILLLPWGMGNHVGAVFMIGFLTYFLVGLELIADGLERPFGTEDDSLPLDDLCKGIAVSTLEVVERAGSQT